jgi:hypothetical protein
MAAAARWLKGMQMRTSSFVCPRSVIAAALLLVLLVLSGCTAERHWGGSSRTGEGGKIKIGLVTKTESNPYFVIPEGAGLCQQVVDQ